MADIDITQEEAAVLIAMEKRCAEEKEWLFPVPGDRLAIPLTSMDKRENSCSTSIGARSNLRKRLTRIA